MRSTPTIGLHPTAWGAPASALLVRDAQAAAPTLAGPAPDDYEALAQAAREAKDAGQLRAALGLYERALEAARDIGDRDRIDRALCNRITVAIALGERDTVRVPLQTVLMRRTSSESAFLAADNLSWVFELSKDFKKGLFYAQMARNHAQAAANAVWLASTYNQAGNCLVGDSRFGEASRAYRQALALLPAGPSPARAGVWLNLGYCAAMLGEHPQAFDLAFRSLRCFRRLGDRRAQAWAHLDLCHAYVQVERAARACRHGRRALALAEATGESDLVKNVLFMLGEAEHKVGDIDAAYELFSRLQRDFYPQQPQLVELLLAVDLHRMVNLRA